MDFKTRGDLIVNGILGFPNLDGVNLTSIGDTVIGKISDTKYIKIVLRLAEDNEFSESFDAIGIVLIDSNVGLVDETYFRFNGYANNREKFAISFDKNSGEFLILPNLLEHASEIKDDMTLLMEYYKPLK